MDFVLNRDCEARDKIIFGEYPDWKDIKIGVIKTFIDLNQLKQLIAGDFLNPVNEYCYREPQDFVDFTELHPESNMKFHITVECPERVKEGTFYQYVYSIEINGCSGKLDAGLDSDHKLAFFIEYQQFVHDADSTRFDTDGSYEAWWDC